MSIGDLSIDVADLYQIIGEQVATIRALKKRLQESQPEPPPAEAETTEEGGENA